MSLVAQFWCFSNSSYFKAYCRHSDELMIVYSLCLKNKTVGIEDFLQFAIFSAIFFFMVLRLSLLYIITEDFNSSCFDCFRFKVLSRCPLRRRGERHVLWITSEKCSPYQGKVSGVCLNGGSGYYCENLYPSCSGRTCFGFTEFLNPRSYGTSKLG